MPKIKTNKKTQTKTEIKDVIPKWDDFKPESIKRVIESGVILPEFKPYANTVYQIELRSEPKYIKHEKGNFFTVDITKNGMKYQMKANGSFRFGLKLILERNNLESIKNLFGVPLNISKNSDGLISVQLL